MSYVVVDLDGTCSDTQARQHLIAGESKRWDEFYSLCGEDLPHADIRQLVRVLGTYNDIIYVTGRVERVRTRTLMWLRHHEFEPGVKLEMRADGDSRADALVKSEMADALGLTPANTFLVLDDRDQVVQMWRARGFRCLQVANGAF